MSKLKKKHVELPSGISEKDVKLEKSIQFSAWIFLIVIAIYFSIWGLFDVVLELIEIEMSAMTYSFIIFCGTSSALCFALATKIRTNISRKRKIFFDWLLGEFLFCMFAIFVVAIYQF